VEWYLQDTFLLEYYFLLYFSASPAAGDSPSVLMKIKTQLGRNIISWKTMNSSHFME